jgi:hypothetical protein
LPVAILALVAVGVMVMGGFFMARQETRIGVASENAQTALHVAEEGINSTLANWQPATFNVGAWNTATVNGAAPGGNWSVSVMPMTMRLYYLDATGSASAGGALWSGATRRVGLLARIITAELYPPAALTTVGDLSFGGSAIVDGRDTNPAAWAGLCLEPKEDKPGIMIDDSSAINYNGNENNIINNQLFGVPKILEQPDMTSEDLLVFGDMTFDELAAEANIVLTSAVSVAPAVVNGQCNTAVLSNWGAPLLPTSPCFNYLPIILLKGENTNFHFTQGIGQGVLLVEGDIQVTGQFEFYGPVIVKGSLITTGGGGGKHFYGGVIAANVSLDDQKVLGTADILYSSCAVTRALIGNGALHRVRALGSRSWVDLSSIMP